MSFFLYDMQGCSRKMTVIFTMDLVVQLLGKEKNNIFLWKDMFYTRENALTSLADVNILGRTEH